MKTSIRFGLLFVVASLPGASKDALGGVQEKDKYKIQKKSTGARGSSSSVLRSQNQQQYDADKEQALAVKRRSLILDIKKFLAEAKDQNQIGELNLRLASLYIEDYYANLAKAQANGNSSSNEAAGSLEKAQGIYRDLLRRNPKHPRRDEMLYFHAVASLDRGRTQEAMQAFQRLADEVPKSKYSSEALVQLGDNAFDNNQFPQAEKYYDRLLQKKYPPLMPYASYKKAWCAYNQEKYSVALSHFQWIIRQGEEGNSSAVRIRAEAIRDIALVFAAMKQTQAGIDFYKELGDGTYRQGLETMAALYQEKGEYTESIRVYETLLSLDGNHPKNPGYEISIIDALHLSHQERSAVDRLFSRLPLYLENSNWYEIHSSEPKVVQEAAQNFEGLAKKYALQAHAEGQKTKNNQSYDTARELYAKYLEHFPKSQEAGKIRFYLAEILFRQSKYFEAATHYAKAYEEPTIGNLKQESLRNALLSLDKEMNSERKKAGLASISAKSSAKVEVKDEESSKLQPYSPSEARFIQLASVYLEKYPTSKEAADILYEQTYLQYDHHDFAKAHSGFWTMVQKYAKHPMAITSAYLILDIQNRKKDYPKLIASCTRFLKTQEFKDQKFRADVSDILRKSELKRIQGIEDSGAFREAAEAYVEYTKNYGRDDEALFEKALYNACICYGKASLVTQALETQEHFLRRFPKSPMREKMVLQVAKTYERIGQFDKASQYFEIFAHTYSRNAQHQNALRLAGLYAWGAGQYDRAENLLLESLRFYPQEKAVEEDLLEVYVSQNNWERAIRYLIQARAVRGVSFSDYLAYTLRIAELQAQGKGALPMKTMEEAEGLILKHGKEISKTAKGIEGIAKVSFWRAGFKERNFFAVKLALPQGQLERNLKRKLEGIKELEREYGRIAALGSAQWGLGAMYKTAYAYRHLANAVLEAPVPGELTAEQVEMYRAEIQKQLVQPFREKSKNFAANCLDKAAEFSLATPWTSQCYGLLSELDSERYPKVRTFALPSLRTALVLPKNGSSKIEAGKVKSFSYPFYSALLFETSRKIASLAIPVTTLYDSNRMAETYPEAIPQELSYRTLHEDRLSVLKKALSSESPDSPKDIGSFAYLNLLRLIQPQAAVSKIQQALLKDPDNEALHSLLGLTYLDLGKPMAAKITWLALQARGVNHPALLNNLGVLEAAQGQLPRAMTLFRNSLEGGETREALVNLGFLYLKNRNPIEAKKCFERAGKMEDDDTQVRAGLAVSALQARDFETAKEELQDTYRKYKSDPYSRLAVAYYWIDIEQNGEQARKALDEYVDAHGLEKDPVFIRALKEASRLLIKNDEQVERSVAGEDIES